MALIAAHLNAGHSGRDSVSNRYILSLFPPLHTPSPSLPVPNKPYGFCGRKASCLLTYLMTNGSDNVDVWIINSSADGGERM